jgi:hypothetical protein
MKDPDDRWPTAAALYEALSTGESTAVVWRNENREPVRYSSPRRGSPAAENRVAGAIVPVVPQPPAAVAVAAPQPGTLVLEPPHLAGLTPEQRKDLRLWHGRVNLFDRIKTMRGYTWATVILSFAAIGGVVGAEDIPPLAVGPIIPLYMWAKVWRRGNSLREQGLKLRRVLFMPRAKWVLPAPAVQPIEQQLEKLAPREVLDATEGAAIRRAVGDRMAILDMLSKMSKQDRALLPELDATVKALVERVAQIAVTLHRLNQSIDWRQIDELDARIAEGASQGDSQEGERRLALLRRQRATFGDLVKRRAELVRQMDSAGLALGNLRLDLIKFQSSGLQSALFDVSNATQEARALSLDIDALLAAASELRSL